MQITSPKRLDAEPQACGGRGGLLCVCIDVEWACKSVVGHIAGAESRLARRACVPARNGVAVLEQRSSLHHALAERTRAYLLMSCPRAGAVGAYSRERGIGLVLLFGRPEHDMCVQEVA